MKSSTATFYDMSVKPASLCAFSSGSCFLRSFFSFIFPRTKRKKDPRIPTTGFLLYSIWKYVIIIFISYLVVLFDPGLTARAVSLFAGVRLHRSMTP